MNNQQPQRRNRFNSIVIDEVHSNVSQEVIEITTDKLTIILTKYMECLERNKEWQLPLGLIASILLALLTTNFKESFGIPASTWLAIFIISLCLSLCWLVKTIWNKKKAMTVADILAAVKNKS